MLLSTKIELTKFAGANLVTTKKGILGVVVPYAGNNVKIDEKTGAVSIDVFHRENSDDRKVTFGYYQANAVFSKEQREAEAAKDKDQRIYPATLGNSVWRNVKDGEVIPQNSPIISEIFLTSFLGAVNYVDKKCVFIPVVENCIFISDKTGRAYVGITHWEKKTNICDFEISLSFDEKRSVFEKSQPKDKRIYPPFLGTAKYIAQAPREVTAVTESDDDFDLPEEFKPIQSNAAADDDMPF